MGAVSGARSSSRLGSLGLGGLGMASAMGGGMGMMHHNNLGGSLHHHNSTHHHPGGTGYVNGNHLHHHHHHSSSGSSSGSPSGSGGDESDRSVPVRGANVKVNNNEEDSIEREARVGGSRSNLAVTNSNGGVVVGGGPVGGGVNAGDQSPTHLMSQWKRYHQNNDTNSFSECTTEEHSDGNF